MHEKQVENIPVPEAVIEAVVEVVAELELEPEAGAVIEMEAGAVFEIEVGAGHKPACTAGTVEPQSIDRDTDVDTAVDMGHIQSIAGSTVDMAAVDTIALHLAA